jgi:hypothetical protein
MESTIPELIISMRYYRNNKSFTIRPFEIMMAALQDFSMYPRLCKYLIIFLPETTGSLAIITYLKNRMLLTKPYDLDIDLVERHVEVALDGLVDVLYQLFLILSIRKNALIHVGGTEVTILIDVDIESS